MFDVGKIVPVILSGGAGSRLWPVSRQAAPKQMLPLVTDRTMIQETVMRFDADMYHPPVFICNADHAPTIRAQLSEIGVTPGAFIVEPMGRNTAPAAHIAALHALSIEDDALFLLVPADHHIYKPQAFRRAVAAGVPIAAQGRLVTFGMTPDHPATGFGYIRKGDALAPGAYHVDSFVEKPPLEVAKAYLASGNYVWNSGIFLGDAKTLIAEMERYAPGVAAPAAQSYAQATRDTDIIALDRDSFATCNNEPVDKAVMERTDLAAVIPCDLGWHDIGSFKALHGLLAEDGLAISGDVLTSGTTNALIDTDGPLVAVVGMENVAVLVREGRVLVLNLDQAQDVKEIVAQLKARERREML